MPDCPADVRLGIGYCLAKLGRLDKARLRFLRLNLHGMWYLIGINETFFEILIT